MLYKKADLSIGLFISIAIALASLLLIILFFSGALGKANFLYCKLVDPLRIGLMSSSPTPECSSLPQDIDLSIIKKETKTENAFSSRRTMHDFPVTGRFSKELFFELPVLVNITSASVDFSIKAQNYSYDTVQNRKSIVKFF